MFQDLIRRFCRIRLSSGKFEKWTNNCDVSMGISLTFVSLISASLGICSFPFTVSLSFCIKSILLYYQRLRIKHYQIQTCPYMTMIITKDKDCDSRKIMQPFLWGISESWRISTSQSLHFVGFSVINPANQRAFVLFSCDS